MPNQNKRTQSALLFTTGGRTDKLMPLPRVLAWSKGAHGVMVIVVGNGHGDSSSNPGWDWLHFT